MRKSSAVELGANKYEIVSSNTNRKAKELSPITGLAFERASANTVPPVFSDTRHCSHVDPSILTINLSMVDCTQESHVIFQTKFHGFGNKLFFLRTRTTYSELKTQAISFAIAQASSRKATPLRGINLPTYIILNGGPSWRLIEMIQVSALIPISVHKTDRCILTPCYLDNPSFHNLRT